MKTLVAALGMTLVGLPILLAQEAEKKEMPEKEVKTDARFEMLKGLVGEWVQEEAEGAKEQKGEVHYKLTGSGSALVETLNPGDKMEMLTVYHMDGENLMLTHYCAMGNQPKMKAEAKAEGKTLTFGCDSVSNVKSHDDPHMHSLTVTFVDGDHVKHEWGLFQDGKVANTHKMSFVRKKS